MYKTRKDERVFVPWVTVPEWHYVRKCIFSEDAYLQKEGRDRLICWQERLWKRCPVAIECTSSLLSAKLTEATGQVDDVNLAKIYSLAVLRSIGMLTDALQQGGRALPMHILAYQVGIPEWIVDLRHEATHSLGVPSLPMVKKAAEFLIGWLRREYWDTLDPSMSAPIKEHCTVEEQSDFRAGDDLRSTLLEYQQEQFQLCVGGKKDQSTLEDILNRLRRRLSSEDARNTLCSLLIQDGYMVPTEDQAAALNVTALLSAPSEDDHGVELDKGIVRFWRPLLGALSREGLVPRLTVAMVTRLHRASSQNPGDPHNDVVLAWIRMICSAMSNDNHLTSFMTKKQSTPESWHPVIVACVEHSSSYSSAVLKILFSTVCTGLPVSTKRRLQSLIGATPDGDTVKMDIVNGDVEASPVYKDASTEEEEAAATLRLQCSKPWSLAPESISWGSYPVGRLPGQPTDPQYLSFLGKVDTHSLGELEQDVVSEVRRPHRKVTRRPGKLPGSPLMPRVRPDEVQNVNQSVNKELLSGQPGNDRTIRGGHVVIL